MKKLYFTIVLSLLAVVSQAQTVLVQHLNGTAYFHDVMGTWQTVQLGQEISAGTHIQTAQGGTVVLAWRDSSTLTLPPSTELVVKDATPASKSAELLDGHVLAQNVGSRFSILTTYGGVGCDTGKFVISSKTGVRSYNGSATVAVREVNGKFHVYNITDDDIVKVAATGQVSPQQAPVARTTPSLPTQTTKMPTVVTPAPPAQNIAQSNGRGGLYPEQAAIAYKPNSEHYDTYRLEKSTQDPEDRFKFSFREAFNITAKYSGLGGSLNPNNPGLYGHNSQYDNGYVGVDSSGNAGGQTWNWGYANANQQVNPANSTIEMDRNTGSSQSSSQNVTMPGFEMEYSHDLIVKPNYHIGVEGALNFSMADIKHSSSFQSTISSNANFYGYTPGTLPPGYNGGSGVAPYNGTFDGPGFLLNSAGSGSSVLGTSSATIVQTDDTKVYATGIRLGPTFTYSFGRFHPVDLHISGGLAVDWLHVNESWTQTINGDKTPTKQGGTYTTGGGNNDAILPGGYISTAVDYRFADHWAVSGGLQWEDLGTYNHNFQGHTVSLDMSKSLYFTLGVNYNW